MSFTDTGTPIPAVKEVAPHVANGLSVIADVGAAAPAYWTETAPGGTWVKWRGQIGTQSGFSLSGMLRIFDAPLPADIRPRMNVFRNIAGFIDNDGTYIYTLLVDTVGLAYLMPCNAAPAAYQPDFIDLDGLCWFVPEAP